MDPVPASIAQRLNNEGVHYLSKGLYGDALHAISNGLTLVKQVLSSSDQVVEKRLPQTMDSDTQSSSNSPTCIFFHLHKEFSSISDHTDAIRDAETFVFCNPVFLPRGVNQVTTLKYYVNLSFILLYNLALTHHLYAMEGEGDQGSLRKALSLYELAYTLQMTEDIEVSFLQTMAIVNNLGQIHTALGNQKESKFCFEHLLSTIMYLNDCGETAMSDNMEDFRVEGFMENVISCILKTPLSAPAA